MMLSLGFGSDGIFILLYLYRYLILVFSGMRVGWAIALSIIPLV